MNVGAYIGEDAISHAKDKNMILYLRATAALNKQMIDAVKGGDLLEVIRLRDLGAQVDTTDQVIA